MAATVSSAWSKPGAWALDSEEHEAELLQQNNNNNNDDDDKPLADFPSLAVAAATKPKKKKAQTYSLTEFIAKPDNSFADIDPVVLPTGPRQRTAEELDRTRLGGGFRNYGDRPNRNSSGGDDSSNSRWGSSRVSDEPRRNGFGARDSNRDMPPSRADETDNWAAAKKPSSGFERRDRDRGGFFDSQTRADESDSWVSNKSFVASEGRRFGSNERERRVVGFGSSGGADSDNWNKKKGDSNVGSESVSVGVGGRPKLVLQPRTFSVSNEGQDGNVAKPKGVNPFGDARPREQVLAEKGQDWKKIDEQLESVKIKETSGDGFGKRGFGSSNGGGGAGRRASTSPETRTERSWRKPQQSLEHRPKSAEKVEEEQQKKVEDEQNKEVEDQHVEEN